MTEFRVATANTLLGQASKDIRDLGELLQADILLLQEVISPKQDNLEAQLTQAGFTAVTIIGALGLAIAVRNDSELKPARDSLRSCVFEKLSWFERLLVKILARQDNEFTERGMVATKLSTDDGKQLTVINVHPGISFASKRIRNRQTKAFSKELQDPYYDGPLLITGDMNHYPKAQAIDLILMADHNLTAIDLDGKPTWLARGSHYEKFARAAMLFSRRSLASYDAELDAVLYRKPFLKAIKSEVIDIPSDHRAIIAWFNLR